jgi:hypothetical protein
MKVHGTFEVYDFKPADITVPNPVTTAVPVGVSTMEKRYSGGIRGRSTTIFTAAYDPGKGTGSYLAMESFEGAVGGRHGTFNFLHSASTTGSDRSNEFFAIVEGSGTGDFRSVSGTGGLVVDAEAHGLWLDLGD